MNPAALALRRKGGPLEGYARLKTYRDIFCSECANGPLLVHWEMLDLSTCSIVKVCSRCYSALRERGA